jgi:hypothetical protein
MRTAVFAVVSFSYYAAISHYYGSDHGVGGCACFSALGQLDGSAHVFFVFCHIVDKFAFLLA